jgi:hypothetical protein
LHSAALDVRKSSPRNKELFGVAPGYGFVSVLEMKIYQGRRTMDGLVVTVDGEPLSEHYEVKQFTKRGFEWTYDGSSPQQLALAVLFDYLGDKECAIAMSEPFMKDVIANLDNDWQLTSDEVNDYLRYRDAALNIGPKGGDVL